MMRTIVLKHPHTHAGNEYATGASLDLQESQSKWLVDIGVADYKVMPAAPKPEEPITNPKP